MFIFLSSCAKSNETEPRLSSKQNYETKKITTIKNIHNSYVLPSQNIVISETKGKDSIYFLSYHQKLYREGFAIDTLPTYILDVYKDQYGSVSIFHVDPNTWKKGTYNYVTQYNKEGKIVNNKKMGILKYPYPTGILLKKDKKNII